MSTDPTPIPAYGEHVPRTVEHWVMCAVCDDDWPCGTAMAYAAGLAAGRTAVAADIRTEFAHMPFGEDTELNQGAATAMVEYCAQLAEGVREPVESDRPRVAARVAEHGPQSRADR